MNQEGGENMAKQSKSTALDIPFVVGTMLKANIMAYVVTSIFVLFASIILTYTNASPKFEMVITLLGVMASAFLAGFDTAKIEDRNGYRWGAVGGSLYFVIFLILGTIIDKLNNVAPSMLFLMAIMILVMSSAAGIISVNSNRHSNSRR